MVLAGGLPVEEGSKLVCNEDLIVDYVDLSQSESVHPVLERVVRAVVGPPRVQSGLSGHLLQTSLDPDMALNSSTNDQTPTEQMKDDENLKKVDEGKSSGKEEGDGKSKMKKKQQKCCCTIS